MSVVEYKTEYEIQKTGLDALHKNLGISGLIRFMQQFNSGYGNYTKDRQNWQKEYTVDEIFNEIKNKNSQ